MRRSSKPRDDLERITRRGVTAQSLEAALGLSAGYLSKVRHGAVTPGAQLALLLRLLARHPTLLREIDVELKPRPVRSSAAALPGQRRALAFIASITPRLDEERVRWAIGGATALSAFGVARPTSDVDIFVDEHDRHVLQVLRDEGASVGALSSDVFIAFPPHVRSGPDDRVDVVFARHEPLRGAVGRATRTALLDDDVALPFLTPLDLCVQKLMSHAPDDERDAIALLTAGLVSRDDVRAALSRAPRLPKGASRYALFHRDRALAERRLRGTKK